MACELMAGAVAGGKTLHEAGNRKQIINNMLSILIDPRIYGTQDVCMQQAAAFVEQTITAREGVTWGPPASRALHELARAVQDARYAPRQTEWPAGELENRIATVLRTLEVRNRVPADAGPSDPQVDA